MKDKSNLIWIDLEMTGLDTQRDYIIEIATIVTDKNLNILAEGPNLVIHQIDEVMNNMDDWNTNQHARTGLTEEVKLSTINEEQAENETIKFLEEFIFDGESPLCGNTICQDRRFLARCMPRLEAFCHYRNLDVSSIREVGKRWFYDDMDNFKKHGNHRALGDIRDSIEELKYYRKTIFKL
ncbi:MAG: oligoribonuclease [Gammaproteobacteria bacterium]|nr:oligoribonuclease [Gammaproteobacteria bacterium]MBT4462169.1 oligoribonuclease [Gammaproteobacteria bacterium]MBT4655028.1 oligoribonuclease [Gammaproteobacteria bacterium]MBT5116458.1 oligoribonuclease [Gammaproteobacteria bacterium]MBT5761140.1 oligoribonuclease [Gammaproteobacteria bacterium]